jgi:hypothetical protein
MGDICLVHFEFGPRDVFVREPGDVAQISSDGRRKFGRVLVRSLPLDQKTGSPFFQNRR